MKLLIIPYEMMLVKITEINRSVKIADISIEYWSKKKTLLYYFESETKQMYIKMIYISSMVENSKYMNYQYNSEQIFITFSNSITTKCNWLLETTCFNVQKQSPHILLKQDGCNI